MVNISVVLETYTVSHEYPATAAVEDSPLKKALDRLHEQSYPQDKMEILVIFDQADLERYASLKPLYPSVRFETLSQASYFSAKNYGFELARGEVVALLDADCLPTKDWLERIARSFENGADVMVGKTRYCNDRLLASTFSVFDFGHVYGDEQGRAVYFNANNLAFRASIVRRHKFDTRVRRNGACYYLWHRLTRSQYKMVYDPGQFAAHGYDIEGWGFVPKHLERGFDMINIFRMDLEGVTPGSRYKQLGVLTPLAMAFGRIIFDFKRIVSNRKDLGIPPYAVPYFYLASLGIRGIEMVGGLIAILRPNYYK